MEFGIKIPGQHYTERPGAYAVLVNEAGQIGVVKNPKGFFLVGGGIEALEEPEEALHREVEEEIGHVIIVGEKIAEAVQYIHVPEMDLHISKPCHFYRATLGPLLHEESEDNHELHWLSKAEAAEQLFHDSHKWAVQQIAD